MKSISIVIPCLNEEKTIGLCVKKAVKMGEVIVADNGSTDNSAEIARSLGAKVVNVETKGYGAALIEGLSAASGEYLVMADADDSYNFEEIEPFVQKLGEGFDFVIGNRFKGKIEAGAMPFLHRHLGTPVLTIIMNFLFKTGISDVNCGMRAMTKDAFLRMKLKSTGMEFASEMIIKASLCGLKIAEVPCNLYKDKRDKPPHLSTWRDGWRHLRFMLLFSSSWTFFAPGLGLLAIGILGMSLLLLRDIFLPTAFIAVTQKHMLSFMLLLMFGFQITSLGVAAQFFNYSEYFDSRNKTLGYLRKYFSLEKGIAFGLVFCSFGALGLLYLLISYYLGVLPYLNDFVRFDLAVFFIAFFMLGIQFIYTSFLLSLFYLKTK